MSVKPPPPLTSFRAGDVVVVSEYLRKTNLGEGHIIDIDVDRETNIPTSALVRFEHGPSRGVWYSLGSLTRLRDFRGNAV